MNLNNKESFLSLIRLGIGHRADDLPQVVDWNEIQSLSDSQGLSGVVLDGIEEERCKRSDGRCKLPGKLTLTQWIGEVLQGYEYRYELYCRAIAELAAFYNSHGYRMMVLKGYACAINWPKPEHRPCGDIDIWLFGEQKKSDELLKKEKGVEIDASHHHHTVFYWRDFMVENHYDFVNVHARRSSAEMEKVFKSLGQDDSNVVEVYGEKVYLPSANLHALFLIKHMVSHFAASEISLRQVLDWAFFVEKHTEMIDWVWLNDMVERYQMKDFVGCINAICVEDLGFDAAIFNGVQFNPQLKDRVLSDILFPAYRTAEPNSLIVKLVYRYRRWKGNAWKQDMCYGEGRWESFWSLLKSHLIKPVV